MYTIMAFYKNIENYPRIREKNYHNFDYLDEIEVKASKIFSVVVSKRRV
jgi:hypothetical protein